MAKADKTGAPRRRREATVASSSEDLTALKALARAGRHADLIERASESLDDRDLDIGARFELHERRLESHNALARMSDARVDVDAMATLARNGSSAMKARAHNGRVRFYMRRDNRRALAEATKAVEAVRKTGDRALEATSVSLLAEGQARIGKHDDALSMSLRAIKLFEALGDGVGLGRARWVNGLVHLMAGRLDEARVSVSAALESARAAGDFYGIGHALNMLMQFDADHANAMRLGQEAINAFERAGDVNQRAMMVGNVATYFERLGLYRRARRMQQEVVSVARSSDLRGLLAYALGNQIGCEIKLHEVDAARALLGDFRLQVAGLADARMESGVEMYTAQVELLTGDCNAAARRLCMSG